MDLYLSQVHYAPRCAAQGAAALAGCQRLQAMPCLLALARAPLQAASLPASPTRPPLCCALQPVGV